MTISAWYIDASEEDQRNPHQQSPNVEVSKADLDKYGVLSWSGINGVGTSIALTMDILTCIICSSFR